MFIKKMLPCCIAISMITVSAYAQQYMNGYDTVDTFVRTRNEQAIKQFKQTHGSLDYTNRNGQTPLCMSIRRRDYEGYLILASNGANRHHPCVQQISMADKITFDKQFKSYISSLGAYKKTPTAVLKELSPVWWGIGGAVGVGAIVAVAAGGGGGGGSSSHANDSNNSDVIVDGTTQNNNGNNNNNRPNNGTNNNSGGNVSPSNPITPSQPITPTTPPVSETVSLPASYFETNEYYNGQFLNPINASQAYAHIYRGTKNTNGDITATHALSDVKVGVIDSGVYQLYDLRENLLQGYNYDFGPCTSKNKTNCWKYNSFWKGVAFVDSKGNQSDIKWLMDKDQYDAWQLTYDANYVWNATDTTPNPNNTLGTKNHGTHVAGIIAASKNSYNTHGVAPNAKIVPVKYDLLGGLSEPIIKLLDNNVKVINASLGTSASTNYDASLAITNASKYASYMKYDLDGYRALANRKTAVFVVAAGNESHTQPSVESGAGLYFPELSKTMIVVVSVDPNNPSQLASSSNQCGVTSDYCIAAPGVGIVSTANTDGGLLKMSGTSMATPVVSGAVALLMGAYPNLTPEQVTSLLFETATNLNNPQKFGHGLLNVGAAMAPVGTLSLATTSQANGSQIAFSQSALTVPQAMSTLLNKAPKHISVLDKYNRSFTLPTGMMFRQSDRDYRIFQNHLHRFMKFDSVHKIEDKNNPIAFRFSTATKKDSNLGIGSMDMMWHLNNNMVRFYYTEDSLYGNGEFFDKTTLNPFSAMDNAYGIENTYTVNRFFDVRFGFATGQNALFKTNEEDNDERGQLTSFQGSFIYKPHRHMQLEILGGTLHEEDSLLGLHGTGAFNTPTTQTYYVGLNASINLFKNLQLKNSYYYGMTPSQTLNTYMRTSRLYSESIAFDARWLLTDTNYFGAFVSSPLHIKKGTAYMHVPSGRDYHSNTIYFDHIHASIKSEKREWDTGIYGMYAVSPNLRLKAQGGIRFNPEHQDNVKPDYQLLFGMHWNWN